MTETKTEPAAQAETTTAEPSALDAAVEATKKPGRLLDEIIEQYADPIDDQAGCLERTMRVGAGATKLHKAITPDMMQLILWFKNKGMGFLTDEASPKVGPYSDAQVKACVIEACLKGLQIVGNEFNILAGRMYITKNGFSRLLREYPGLTDLVINPSVPDTKDKRSIVHVEASWKLNGAEWSITRDIPCRVNVGQTDDAILGKADRKIKCMIYSQITGSEQDGGEVDTGDGEQKPQGLSAAINAAADAKEAASTEQPKEPKAEQPAPDKPRGSPARDLFSTTGDGPADTGDEPELALDGWRQLYEATAEIKDPSERLAAIDGLDAMAKADPLVASRPAQAEIFGDKGFSMKARE